VPSFEIDIKPLFREHDREEMEFAFDLWSYDDVKAEAESIYERISDGSMPCDMDWPDEDLALFRVWIDEGCAP
jgi:hypothetical protein